MNQSEAMWGAGRGKHLYQTAETGVRMMVERMNIEKMGLPLESLPLCTEEESIHIEELLPRAKEGFALTLKSEKSIKSQDQDLLDITTPLAIEHLWSKFRLTDRQNTLPEFNHVVATLNLLAQSSVVSFYNFENPPANIDYQTGIAQTYWAHSTDSFECVWNHMAELECLIRYALYSSEPMHRQDMLKIAHFFMTSKTLAHIFDNL